jgi:hypothetical protein
LTEAGSVETAVPPNIKTSRNWGLMNFLYALQQTVSCMACILRSQRLSPDGFIQCRNARPIPVAASLLAEGKSRRRTFLIDYVIIACRRSRSRHMT